jgi:hypothetical protein
MTDTKIENTGVAAAIGLLEHRNVRNAVIVNKDARNGAIDPQVIEVPCSVKDGNNAHSCFNVIDMEKRRVGIWVCSIYRDPVQIDAQRRQVQSEVLQLDANTKALARVRLYCANDILTKTWIIGENYESASGQQSHGGDTNPYPCGNPHP